MSDWNNPMRPLLGTLVGIKDLADAIKLFQVKLHGDSFDYQPGQFMLNPEVVVTVVARQFTRVPIWEV